jgi:uncharacterized protein (DUF488 family)
MANTVFSIGHSNHTWAEFSALVKLHGIEVLVDARSNPVSKYADFANTRALPRLLAQEGIGYAFMGDSLGGKPPDRTCYDDNGKPDYRKMRSRELFREGIDKLLELAEDSAVVLMCSEEDPTRCHRRLLIGPALVERDVKLRHIRGDGTIIGSEALGSKKAYQRQLQGMLPLEVEDS